MTQVFVFSDHEPLRIWKFDERADQITARVNQGLWESYLGYEAYPPSQSWQARQVGKAVLLTNPPSHRKFFRTSNSTRAIFRFFRRSFPA